MNNNEMRKMAEMEATYWWHTGRNAIIASLLKTLQLPVGTKIVNIGCGTGGTIPTLVRFGETHSYDPSPEAVQICREKTMENVFEFDGKKLPCPETSFDLAVALDVLEHIENDHEALRDWIRVLKPGGRLLITVPAYQWLWSGHDEALGHYRRYTACELHRKLNQAGFIVGKRSYAITLSFPLILGYRLIDSLKRSDKTPSASYVMLPGPINSLLTTLLKIEGRLLRHMNFPFGTSVVIIARKPAKTDQSIWRADQE